MGLVSPLEGKKAIVTGGTRGIGFAIAQMLISRGADVLICGRREQNVNNALQSLSSTPPISPSLTPGRVFGGRCDVANAGDIRKFYTYADDTLGSLDVLVNNAGIGIFRSVADLSPDDWDQTIATNLTSVFHFCHLAVDRLRRTGGGAIINISSLAGKNAFAGGAAYNASKFGLNGFSEALMLDHRQDNIRVCSVMPGSVSTDFGGAHGHADWKIQPGDVAEVVRMVLEMPERTMVSRVEIRPSRPSKS